MVWQSINWRISPPPPPHLDIHPGVGVKPSLSLLMYGTLLATTITILYYISVTYIQDGCLAHSSRRRQLRRSTEDCRREVLLENTFARCLESFMMSVQSQYWSKLGRHDAYASTARYRSGKTSSNQSTISEGTYSATSPWIEMRRTPNLNVGHWYNILQYIFYSHSIYIIVWT